MWCMYVEVVLCVEAELSRGELAVFSPVGRRTDYFWHDDGECRCWVQLAPTSRLLVYSIACMGQLGMSRESSCSVVL